MIKQVDEIKEKIIPLFDNVKKRAERDIITEMRYNFVRAHEHNKFVIYINPQKSTSPFLLYYNFSDKKCITEIPYNIFLRLQNDIVMNYFEDACREIHTDKGGRFMTPEVTKLIEDALDAEPADMF